MGNLIIFRDALLLRVSPSLTALMSRLHNSLPIERETKIVRTSFTVFLFFPPRTCEFTRCIWKPENERARSREYRVTFLARVRVVFERRWSDTRLTYSTKIWRRVVHRMPGFVRNLLVSKLSRLNNNVIVTTTWVYSDYNSSPVLNYSTPRAHNRIVSIYDNFYENRRFSNRDQP